MKIEISIEKEYESEEEGKVELSKLPPALRKKVAKYMSTKKPEKPMRGLKEMMDEAELEDEEED
jgi:CRISPR/Cas system CSM-associated protein Csm2 small subunit